MTHDLIPGGFSKNLDAIEEAVLDDPTALRELARQALIRPQSLTMEEVQEIGFALIVATRANNDLVHDRDVPS